MKNRKKQGTLSIIYDGECPFCSAYVKMLRLQKTIEHVELINARDNHPLVIKVIEQGYDLDEGMVALYQEQTFHGAQAVHFLSALSTKSDLFNHLMKGLFRHKRTAALLYPLLRFGRNCALFLKRKTQIKNKPR